ncbi:MAG: arylsulfatase [Pirellulales bacterium]
MPDETTVRFRREWVMDRHWITGWVVALALVLSWSVDGRGAETARPNILILIADDLGFTDLGCYGSEINTPTLDGLAATGTIFSNFHTATTCSPTRAMLLTGVDHHRAGMGTMYEYLDAAPEQIGRPGYEGHLNQSVVTIAEVLQSAGYSTAISGKWHLGNQLAVSQAPIGRGFEHSWVLWSGWSEHFAAALPRHVFVDGARGVPFPAGKYSTEWYTDKAIEFADRAIDTQKPFFLVTAYTAPHWPLQAPADAIARQKGKYDAGYEVLRRERIAGLARTGMISADVALAATPGYQPPLHHAPRLAETERWQQLNAKERAHSARLMELHAAMVEVMDQQIGRLLDHLKSRGQLDNTMIVFLSDNGASSLATPAEELAEQYDRAGQAGSFLAYGPEWARASTGPLRLMKGYPSEGGIRVPAIVRLPGAPRHQTAQAFASVLDLAPTIYDLADVDYPKSFQDHSILPLEGQSMLPLLKGESERVHGEDHAMGWELFGRAAYRRGNWKITWIEKPFGASDFELFDVAKDPGESRDVRREHPDVFRELSAGFDEYVQSRGVIISRPPYWSE